MTSSGEPVTILKETPHNLHGPSVAEIEVKKSHFHFRIISFSTKFRRIFDRCPFDELSFDENSTNGRVRRDVRFDGKSRSTKGLSRKSHGRHAITPTYYKDLQTNIPIIQKHGCNG